MSIIVCALHGPSPIRLVCPHIRSAVLERRDLPPRATYPIMIDGGLAFEHDICSECIVAIGLPMPPRGLEREDIDGPDAFAMPGDQTVCVRCLRRD